MAKRDKAGRPIIAITGIGLVTPLGVGKADNWAKLLAGQSGIRRISRFPIEGLRTTIAGAVDQVYQDYMSPADLSERIAILAGEEAIAEAGIGSKGAFPGPLCLAVPPLEIEWHYRIAMAEQAKLGAAAGYAELTGVAREPKFATYYESMKYGIIGENLAAHFGTIGSPISLNTACASGGSAIQLGVEAIRRGECEVALAIGADGSLTPESLVRFSLLSALSTQNDPPEQASKPFSKNRDGFVLAEGAWVFVLEEYEHAKARGAKMLAEICGYGSTCEAFHRVRLKECGEEPARAIALAMQEGGIAPQDVHYVNLHGTSTKLNDRIETQALKLALGEQAARVPMSALKSQIGHPQGACGAAGVAATIVAMERGRIAPTINLTNPDPKCDLDYVREAGRRAEIEHAVCNCIAFGSKNSALVLRKAA